MINDIVLEVARRKKVEFIDIILGGS